MFDLQVEWNIIIYEKYKQMKSEDGTGSRRAHDGS